MKPARAVILGSAWGEGRLGGRLLAPVTVETPFGSVTLHRYAADAWVLFRHGVPHRWLPHRIPYRAHAAALAAVGCGALLVTSSVGVLDPALPLDRPILVDDLLMLDNRLPDGTAATIFVEPFCRPGEGGHLVLDEGLFSRALAEQVEALAGGPLPRAVFGYAQGPRNKTAAENAAFRLLGAQVNSMTLAPEVVLAAELEIPVAAVVVGHKYSGTGPRTRVARDEINAALGEGRAALDGLARAFLERARPVAPGNRIYRYPVDFRAG